MAKYEHLIVYMNYLFDSILTPLIWMRKLVIYPAFPPTITPICQGDHPW